MSIPNLNEEKKLWKKGFKRVVGLDEVGRGCVAGPVVAAAVTIVDELRSSSRRRDGRRNLFLRPSPPFAAARVIKKSLFQKLWESDFHNIKDSKKLTPKKREEFYKILRNHPAIKWGIGKVSEKVIDKINILEATKLAIERATEKLKIDYPSEAKGEKERMFFDYLILDGKMKLDLPIPQKSIVKADEKVFSCCAASIIAKVWRDRTMEKYHQKYPRYGFDRHKGYLTKYHIKKLKKYGPCAIHRKSFKPVAKYLI